MFTFYHLQGSFKHIILFDACNFGGQGRNFLFDRWETEAQQEQTCSKPYS